MSDLIKDTPLVKGSIKWYNKKKRPARGRIRAHGP